MTKGKGVYRWAVTIPDRLYPFKTQIEGQWVRGIRSYNAALAAYQEKYGLGHYGFKIGAYRQVFHLLGSILFLIIAAFLSQTYLGGVAALYAFLAIAVGLISYQEFYLHRRMYQQLWRKGLLDWTAWCLPFVLYMAFHFR